MEEKKGLSSTAYGEVKGEDYVPYVSVKDAFSEITVISIVFGCIVAIIFGAANTYLGLKVGMTIAAGIPAAIISTSILKGIFKKNNILETNIIQSMASMGESLAGGLIFIIPAVIVLGHELKLTTIIVVAILGGLLGILFVIPIRKYLIVEEHGNLIYPEAMATAEVLVNSSAGGSGFKNMMTGLLGGGIYKFFSGAFQLWGESPVWIIKPFHGTVFGIDAMASLLGVGYIVGIQIATYMFAGALVANFTLVPIIKYFGDSINTVIFPSAKLISDMTAREISSSYVKYIGAGAVAAGGLISIIKSMPTIIRSFKTALSGMKSNADMSKDEDLPITWVIGGSILVFVASWIMPKTVGTGWLGAILGIICSFFFAVVSARIVGLIGSSNNPISGMTIASLLFITGILKATGKIGDSGMLAAIIASSIVCVAVAIAGGAAQSLKTTFIIGGTPKKVEVSMFIATVVSSVVVGAVILMLSKVYGLGSTDVPAPQANMMAMIVQGVMSGELPWTLVIAGMTLAFMCELMGIPVLPFALGLYLPINLSAGVLIGGILRVLVEKKYKKNENQLKIQNEKGILTASGLVAGDALVGIIIAIFAALKLDSALAIGPKIMPKIAGSNWTSAVVLFIFATLFYRYTVKIDNN